ncbi:MAG: serine/threonine-protein kinase, partial [Dermatophilaceae bacterium]
MSRFEPIAAPPTLPGYAVSRLIGRGATSTVWACVEEQTGAEVAVKVADLTAYRIGEVLHRAARETAVLQGVRCEHVVRLHRTLHTPGGGVALVMDLADGGSLADLVAARGRLTDEEAATVFTALATALASLHEDGVVHGDLAPGNVLFTRAGKPMVADFASARLVGESDPPLIEGTPGFVAPEVARGDIPTEASDAYGLGALAWFALTGKARTGSGEPDEADALGFLGPSMGPVVAPLLAGDPGERPGLPAAARGFFGAATPVPVVLVDGVPDPATALTKRIRAQASEDPSGHGAAAGPGGPTRAGRHAASAPTRQGGRRVRRPAR